MELGELVAQLDRAWDELATMVAHGESDRYGPPTLLKLELEMLDGCIHNAKATGDLPGLRRCLGEVTRHIKRLKPLSLAHPAEG